MYAYSDAERIAAIGEDIPDRIRIGMCHRGCRSRGSEETDTKKSPQKFRSNAIRVWEK